MYRKPGREPRYPKHTRRGSATVRTVLRCPMGGDHPGHCPQAIHRARPGRLVRSKVIDGTGRGLPGICVVLIQWHVHTDSDGYFHGSPEDPVPQQVMLEVHEKYSSQCEELKTTVALSQLEGQPITLKNR